MGMSRRDTIIIAVLINTGLLALLFATAMHTEADPADLQPEVQPVVEAPAPVPEPVKLTHLPDPKPAEPVAPVQEPPKPKPKPEIAAQEITVQRGDFLARIAREHGVTVNEIMRANNLNNHRLYVGQVLKLPEKSMVAIAAEKPVVSESKEEYYTIRKGDNPWTIAKKHRVDFDELLRLNNLDETKARNLKVGDKLRVR